jgi:hypothetical protein
MRVETVQANGSAGWVAGLVGTQSERFRKVTLTADQLNRLTIVNTRHSFDGDGRCLTLARRRSVRSRHTAPAFGHTVKITLGYG